VFGDIEPYGSGPGEVDPYEPNDSHAVNRTTRTIRFRVEADIEIEVVEPPKVHNAEIKAAAKNRVSMALSNMTLGVMTGLNVRVTEGKKRD